LFDPFRYLKRVLDPRRPTPFRRKEFAMPAVALNLTALAVAGIFYAYRDRCVARLERAKMLRERITYLLWTASQQVA
jgi:hypothetical protein